MTTTVVNGVVIPPLLEQFRSDDPDEYPVYWMIRREDTMFPDPVRLTLVKPVREKVAVTQDLSLLLPDDRAIARSVNNVYNTDFTSFTWVTTSTPPQSTSP